MRFQQSDGIFSPFFNRLDPAFIEWNEVFKSWAGRDLLNQSVSQKNLVQIWWYPFLTWSPKWRSRDYQNDAAFSSAWFGRYVAHVGIRWLPVAGHVIYGVENQGHAASLGFLTWMVMQALEQAGIVCRNGCRGMLGKCHGYSASGFFLDWLL